MRSGANPAFVFSNSLLPIWLKNTLEGTVIKCLPLTELVMLHSEADVKKHFFPKHGKGFWEYGRIADRWSVGLPGHLAGGAGYRKRGRPSRSDGVPISASAARVGAMSTERTGSTEIPGSTPGPKKTRGTCLS